MVNVTEKAANEIKRVMAEQNDPDVNVLRVAVAGGGCSGFQYRLGFDKGCDAAKDHVTEQHGLKVAVDKKSDLYLDGTDDRLPGRTRSPRIRVQQSERDEELRLRQQLFGLRRRRGRGRVASRHFAVGRLAA